MHKVWAEMERCVDLGLIKSIGVSNVTVPLLLDMLAYCRIKPVMNQIELHPYFPQLDLVNFHAKLGIAVTAYSPLGASGFGGKGEALRALNLFSEPVLKEIADKHGKTPAQIVLNWHLQRGHVLIPKTTKLERLAENFQVYDFTLTPEEVEQVTALNQNARFFNPKVFATFINTPLFD